MYRVLPLRWAETDTEDKRQRRRDRPEGSWEKQKCLYNINPLLTRGQKKKKKGKTEKIMTEDGGCCF